MSDCRVIRRCCLVPQHVEASLLSICSSMVSARAKRRVLSLVIELSERAHRWPLEVPVSFTAEGLVLRGSTINVSSSGLLAWFPQPPELWTMGEIELLAGGYYLTVQVRTARVEGREAGMSFLIHTELDQTAVNILVAHAAGLRGPRP